mmetsp:Transcript_20162/g.45819  ORF Transcript_20162/g.45819 Transcript_20162/m.45819 type:complete len:370 (-) Transcript_20162:184-1293(-)
MGQEASLPATDKESGSGSAPGLGLAWGFSSMQGWRDSMEDAHFAAANLGGRREGVAAFGVLDGHGGAAVAELCGWRLPMELSEGPPTDDRTALVDAFEGVDELLFEEEAPGLAHEDVQLCGCTAIVCLVRPQTLVVASAGDCRAVLCRKGEAVPLSEDHKPGLPAERERIECAGGFVEEQQVGPITLHRVNGGLSCSRAIGDLAYKSNARKLPSQQMVCSTPEVREVAREVGDEFLILACDGVWDVISSQDAVDFVSSRLAHGQDLSGIADDLLDRCLSPDLVETNGLGGDNMTALIVTFARAEVDPSVSITADLVPAELEKEAVAESSPVPFEGEAKAITEISINEPEVFVNGEEGATRRSSRPDQEG